jgi:hypothetical protein
MVAVLDKIGIPRITIRTRKDSKSPTYYLRVDGIELRKLFHYLYDGVPSTQYLQRKYDIFKLCDLEES